MKNDKNIENIEDILLKDMPLFYNNKNVLIFFKSLNLFTLKDLLNCKNIFNLINLAKIRATTKNEARGLIELTRYKYLGEPLIMDSNLDNIVTIVYLNLINEHFDFGEIALERFGFSQEEINRINRFLLLKKTNGEFYKINNNLAGIGTLLEILTEFSNINCVNKFSLALKEKITIYQKAYYEQKNIASKTTETEIEALQVMIDKLTEKTLEYKKTIMALQSSLDKKSNNKGEKHEKR